MTATTKTNHRSRRTHDDEDDEDEDEDIEYHLKIVAPNGNTDSRTAYAQKINRYIESIFPITPPPLAYSKHLVVDDGAEGGEKIVLVSSSE
jgi:hypothetical protein